MAKIIRLPIALAIATASAACAHGGAATTAATAPAPANAAVLADSAHKTKPYASVITAATVTKRGLFVTHRLDDKLYFEIPTKELGHDFLMVGRYAAAAPKPGDFSDYGGDQFTEHVLRWERSGDRVLLRSVSFAITADSTLPVAKAVAASNYAPIVAAFQIETFGPDSAPVVDVTRLYTTNVVEFVALQGQFDEKRSFVERVVSFPDNVEVEASQTVMPPTPPPPPGYPPGYTFPPQPAKSVLAHWSMVRLPEHPMKPRLFDERVGFFSAEQNDFGTSEQRSAVRVYVTRYRLEKKDPSAALSEPVQPIVYYVDPATPKWLVPYVERGVEEWQKAFEAAGFKNGIVAREVPTNDSTWSPEDVRHTMIRWLALTVENSVGPHVHDPRTGEILNGSVRMFHNIMNLMRDWYFTQVASVDPRVQRLPFPDSLMGRLVQFVVVHEVGHTLGLQHDMKGSAMYPADSVRSRTWTHCMGHSPSIMDYCRFNYVAQPEDSIALDDLVPRVGPYDVFAIRWGYSPVPSARTPQDEKPVLDGWAREQDSVPWYRFETVDAAGSDPRDETEAVGDADPVKSTGYGLKNIARISHLLIPATIRPGENNDDLRELYDRLVHQWADEIGHVVNLVGGSETQEKNGSQPGPRFTPLPRARQAAAVQFISEHAFQTPTYFLDDALLRRMEPEGAVTLIRDLQQGIIENLMDDSRMGRLIEYDALASDHSTVYSLSDMLGDVRHGVWTELDRAHPTIDAFRRNLQRAYLEVVKNKLAVTTHEPGPSGALGQSLGRRFPYDDPASRTDARAILRGELESLDTQVRSAMSHATDRLTRLHLGDVRVEIDRILHPAKLAS